MRKKLMTLTLAGTLAVGGATIAMADPSGAPGQGPDPNGPAKFGLCKAYFANGGNGQSHNAPPFRNLADAAEENGQSVAEFCEGVTPGPN